MNTNILDLFLFYLCISKFSLSLYMYVVVAEQKWHIITRFLIEQYL